MIEFLKSKIVKHVMGVVLKLFAVFILLTIVIFPGLTAKNTLINSICGLLGVLCIFYGVYLLSYELFNMQEDKNKKIEL